MSIRVLFQLHRLADMMVINAPDTVPGCVIFQGGVNNIINNERYNEGIVKTACCCGRYVSYHTIRSEEHRRSPTKKIRASSGIYLKNGIIDQSIYND